MAGISLHEATHDINRDWENDCRVVFRRNAVQSLQIAELKINKRLYNIRI